MLDQPIIYGTISRLKVATCVGDLKRRGITLTDDEVRQPAVDTYWCGCCRTALHGKYIVTGLWADCSKNPFGWVVMGKMEEKSK